MAKTNREIAAEIADRVLFLHGSQKFHLIEVTEAALNLAEARGAKKSTEEIMGLFKKTFKNEMEKKCEKQS